MKAALEQPVGVRPGAIRPASRGPLVWRGTVAMAALSFALQLVAAAAPEVSQLYVDAGHPWRPPFGLDRVGAPLQAHVALAALPEAGRNCLLIAYAGGRQVESHPLRFTETKAPFWATVPLAAAPEEVSVVSEDPGGGRRVELRREPVALPEFVAEAIARPDRRINPVDLGTVLVPDNWLLLAVGQETIVEVAALSRSRAVPHGRLKAWFGDGPATESEFPLEPRQRATTTMRLAGRTPRERDLLRIAFLDDGRVLWEKQIPVTTVTQPPKWPAFGAVELKLRYDAPISVTDSNTGRELPPLDHATAWDQKLNDVVVFLPNGSRFVFWRGTNYVPFWAGAANTGVSYQWAENLSEPVVHADGTRDFPEPLYDFELRYGRVQIIESTPSRVHVRWTYQATDVDYRVWGDQAREDFYFYPDGFGTRVLTIASKPNSRYQMSEFLILTPQAAFPLQALPEHIADVLFLDGEKVALRAPFERAVDPATGKQRKEWPVSRDRKALFRIFAHKDDPAAAIYFHAEDKSLALFSFTGLYDRGELVSPVYWGSHWPLARGKFTAYSIDDRIFKSPAHNSIGGWLPQSDGKGGWGNWEVKPFESQRLTMPNSLGRVVEMDFNRWSWLIAKTDAPDDVLLQWANSYAAPPSLEVSGAEFALPSFSQERRALRLTATRATIVMRIRPQSWTVNPVFEVRGATGRLQAVTLNGRAVPAADYAWDGQTFWIRAAIDSQGATLELQFDQAPR